MRVADLKRLPIGTKLRLIHCLLGPVAEEKQLRTILKVNSNTIQIARFGMGRSCSWLDIPKASQFRSDDNGFTIFEGTEIAAQYVFVKD